MTQPSAQEDQRARIEAGDVCGYSWDTTHESKRGREVRVHTCQKCPGHPGVLHACILDAGHPNMIERCFA